MSGIHDEIMRAMTSDGGFRLMTLRATELSAGVIAAQTATGSDAGLLAELVMAAVLVRETMAPGLRVQAILQGAERGSVVADSHPGGMARGLLSGAGDGPLELGAEPHLQVVRTMPGGQLHQSVVAFARETGVSGAIMTYMQESEQIVSMAAVGCVFDGAGVATAGGYILQLLPGLDNERLAAMTERLAGLPPLEELLVAHDGDPGALAAAVLGDVPYEELERSPIRFGCNCSRERVVAAVATLGRDEIADIVAAGRSLDISCDYCNTPYSVAPEELRGLLDPS